MFCVKLIRICTSYAKEQRKVFDAIQMTRTALETISWSVYMCDLIKSEGLQTPRTVALK